MSRASAFIFQYMIDSGVCSNESCCHGCMFPVCNIMQKQFNELVQMYKRCCHTVYLPIKQYQNIRQYFDKLHVPLHCIT